MFMLLFSVHTVAFIANLWYTHPQKENASRGAGVWMMPKSKVEQRKTISFMLIK